MGGSFRAARRSVAAMMPALLLGLAAGVTGGVWAAGALDTTPYDATDFNTASRDAHQAGKAEGWKAAQEVSSRAVARMKESSSQQVDQLKATIDTMKSTLKERERALKKADKAAEEQHAKLVRAQGTIAETTAALNNATGELAGGQGVEGTVKVSSVQTLKAAQKSPGCAEQLRSYQVRVMAGADVTVATARLVGAEAAERPVGSDGPARREPGDKRRSEPESVTVTCTLTYSANLPTPLGSGYRFVAVAAARPAEPLASKTASGDALENGSAPTLSISR